MSQEFDDDLWAQKLQIKATEMIRGWLVGIQNTVKYLIMQDKKTVTLGTVILPYSYEYNTEDKTAYSLQYLIILELVAYESATTPQQELIFDNFRTKWLG